MTLSYSLRLFSLCFASFFLVHAAARLALRFAETPAQRFAERLSPRAAARLLLVLRLFPGAIALAAVLGLCAPSYLRFESNLLSEQVGISCLAIALLGAAICALALGRGFQAIVSSVRFRRACLAAGEFIHLPSQPSPMLVIPSPKPFLAEAGILRPQVMISQNLVADFSRDELAAALHHECAHWISRDNLKRLLFAFLPGVLPLWSGFSGIERSWAKFAERAADDFVSAQGRDYAVSLAAALVRLARIGQGHSPMPTPLATSPLGGTDDLSGRVHRLLDPARAADAPAVGRFGLLCGVVGAWLACCITAMAWSATLSPVHELLERLLH